MTALIGSPAVQRMLRPDKFGRPAPLSLPRAAKVNGLRVTDATVDAAYDAMIAEYSLTREPTGPIDPFLVPNVYTDPEGNTEAILKVRYDGIAALNFAIRHYLTGSESAAEAACNQIDPWLTITSFSAPAGSDTRLAWSYTWPFFIAAGMLLRGSAAWTVNREDDLKALTQLSITAQMSTAYTNPANQGAWGVVFEMAAASLLNDPARFRLACNQWRKSLDTFLVDDVPVDEVYREGGGQGNGSTGLFYSNFYLTALTYGAEWARFNGVWLYDHVTPDGSSLRGLYEKVAAWTRYPATFSYNSSGVTSVVNEIAGGYEVLNSVWPNADAAWLIENKTIADRYGLRYLTVTHHGQQLRG